MQSHFHFSVSGLLVHGDLLGTSTGFDIAGRTVTLTFPASETDFGVRPDDLDMYTLGGGMKHSDTDVWLTRSVQLIRVTVELEIPMPTGDTSEVSPEVINQTQARLADAAEVARAAMRRYLDFARTTMGQHWLGHSGKLPRVAWLTEVRDVATGERVRTGFQDPLQLFGGGHETAITSDIHRDLIDRVRGFEEPSLPEVLLADAKYLAWRARPPQSREALLLAAIACEVAIRDCLRAACPEISRAVLEYAIASPRDVSVQAIGLFDKAALAVTGRSLRLEDKELYKQVDILFQNRNDVAHRGGEKTSEAVRGGIMAAANAIVWAGTLKR